MFNATGTVRDSIDYLNSRGIDVGACEIDAETACAWSESVRCAAFNLKNGVGRDSVVNMLNLSGVDASIIPSGWSTVEAWALNPPPPPTLR